MDDCTIPFTSLLKKDYNFSWNEDCKLSFEQFKTYLANPPILQLTQPNKPFFLYTSTSSKALSVVLAQHD